MAHDVIFYEEDSILTVFFCWREEIASVRFQTLEGRPIGGLYGYSVYNKDMPSLSSVSAGSSKLF